VIVDCLNRMQLPAHASDRGDTVMVQVPPTRSDVLHECDIIEDVAIAFGYNNIPKRIPKTQTQARQLPVNAFSDLLRFELSAAGFDEILTLALCSIDENFTYLRHPYKLGDAVVLANPQTEEFQICRTSLLPGLLKTIFSNRSTKIADGMKLFEISDVVMVDGAADVGARNNRHLAALYTSHSSGFEVIHGLVDRIMRLCEVRPPVELELDAGWESEATTAVTRYSLVPSTGTMIVQCPCALPIAHGVDLCPAVCRRYVL
jgi:phenylalanyl-tRNA synthetase beta chain